MNVLIIHRYFWPESLSTLPIMFRDVVNFHFENGDNVNVVCGAQSDYTAEYQEEFGSKLSVDTFKSDIDRNLSLFGRLKNAFKLFRLSQNFLRENSDIDLVYLVSYPPLLAGFLSSYIRTKNKKARTIYFVQDILNYRIPTAIGKSIYNRFHKWTLSKVNLVITLSDSMKSELLSLFNDSERNKLDKSIWIIPNFSTETVDLDSVLPPKKVDIVYAGNHGHAQNLFHFIDVLALLDLPDRPIVHFYGSGTARQKLISYAKDKNVDISFNEPVSRAEAQVKMSEARFGLVGAVPGLMRFAFPSKLAAYNTAGTSGILMAEEENEVSHWIRNEEFGNVIDPTQKALAKQQILDILNGPSGEYNATALREKAALFYSKSNYIERLRNMLKTEKFDVR